MENTINRNSEQRQILIPVKLIAYNKRVSFCYVLNQSMIVYMAGMNLLLENIRNHQQMIIWTCETQTEIEDIFRHTNCIGQMHIIILVKGRTQHCLKIFEIDWNSYFHKKNQSRHFNLVHIDIQNQICKAIFDKKGQNLGIVQKHLDNYYLTFYCLSSNKIISSFDIPDCPHQLKSYQINNQQYLVVINSNQLNFYSVTCKYYQHKQKISQSLLDFKQEFRQVEFQETQRDQILILILTNFGKFKIGCLTKQYFQNFITIDLTLNQPYNLAYPSSFTSHNNKIVFGYQNSRKISYITYSLLNYSQYTITTSENILYYQNQQKQFYCEKHDQLKEMMVSNINSSGDNCIYVISLRDSMGQYSLKILDTLQSLTSPQSIQIQAQRVFGNLNFSGKCILVTYLPPQSSFFVLYFSLQNKYRLAYVSIDFSTLKEVSPKSIIRWDQQIKNKPINILSHLQFQTIFIIQQQTIKVHYYSKEKLFQPHCILNISNCYCASFNTLANKLYVANPAGLFLIDINTYEVSTFLNNSIYLGKTPQRFFKLSTFQMGLQVVSSTQSIIFQIYDSGQASCIATNQLDTENSLKQNGIIYDCLSQTFIVLMKNGNIKFLNHSSIQINTVQANAQCIQLYKKLDILLIGSKNGSIYMCRWPQLINSTLTLSSNHQDVIGYINIHSGPILSLNFSSNYRYIYSFSENGEMCICEFYHENSTIISRQASLHILKKSNCKPICCYSITSRQIENQRQESIIKIAGKQAKKQQKNQNLCKQINEELMRKIFEEKQKSKMELKQQLQTCCEEVVVRELTRKIQVVKGAIIDIKFKWQKILPEIDQKYQEKMKKIFKQKHQLELTCRLLNQKFTNQITVQDHSQNQQFNSQNQVFHTQISEIQKGLVKNQSMQQIFNATNKKLWINSQAQADEDLLQIKQQLDAEIQQLHNHKKQMTAKIRRLTFSISQMNQKQKCFMIRNFELQNSVKKLSSQLPNQYQYSSNMQKRLNQAKAKSEAMMIEARTQQYKKQMNQIKGFYSQSYFQQLQKQYIGLKQALKQLQSHELELQDQFETENRKRLEYSKLLQQKTQQVNRLRVQRNSIKRKSNIKRNKVNIRNRNRVNIDSQNINITQFKQNNPLFDKYQEQEVLCGKIDRMNKIKNQKIKKCIIINDKLIKDNNKLTSQLNQLRRYNDFLIKKQKKLKMQISRGSLSIKEKNINIRNPTVSLSQTQKNSFYQKNNSKSHLLKKTNCALKRGFFSLYNNSLLNQQNSQQK